MPKFTAIWTDKTQIAPTVYEIILETTDSFETYIPGQYINIDFEDKEFRSYSIAEFSSNIGKTTITLIVEILPNGLASGYFESNQPPQSLNCIGPSGRFNLSTSARKKIFIVTGTGLAPIIAMIGQLESQVNNDFEIIFGVRSKEYDFLPKYINSPEIKTTVCVSQPSLARSKYFIGRVTDYYSLHSNEYQNCDFYLCGNPNMVSDMKNLLVKNDIPEDQIFTEKFLLKTLK
jgi:ferredoxin-NADP reductase